MRLPLVRTFTAALAILVAAIAALIWLGAAERWIGDELRSLADAHLNPSFDFDDLSYRFPSTVTLRGVRFTSRDPDAAAASVDILEIGSATLELARIPWPNRPLRMRRIDVTQPTMRLVRSTSGDVAVGLLGYSELLKAKSGSDRSSPRPATRPSDLFQVRTLSIRKGRLAYDPRDGSDAVLLIDGIGAALHLAPEATGAYSADLVLEHAPVFRLAARGVLDVDDRELDVKTLSLTLKLGRQQDHYLTPSLQKFAAEHDITGALTVAANGTVDLADARRSRLRADVQLRQASYESGSFGVALDRVSSRISVEDQTAAIEFFEIDALGGSAELSGRIGLEAPGDGEIRFDGRDLQIGGLLRGADDTAGTPSFSGLLAFTGTLSGPMAEIDTAARGGGHLTLQKARLARLPVLSTLDEALDRAAEAAMRQEHTGHDVLSLHFSFDGDRARIAKLRMNSRWYGIRGRGDLYFDSRLDGFAQGGPIQRLENEIGVAGDVLGEITETILRARITGRIAKPVVGIEVLRQPTPF